MFNFLKIIMSRKYYWNHCGANISVTQFDTRENREVRCPYCNELLPQEEREKALKNISMRKLENFLKK